jgi:hypothetical protein
MPKAVQNKDYGKPPPGLVTAAGSLLLVLKPAWQAA